MAIQISGTTVIDNSRTLVNVIGLKTVAGQSILGTGNIATGLTPNTQQFDSSGTWTKPPGTWSRYKVEIWSGGGSGGTGRPGYVPGGGGGGGGYWSLEGPINDLGATETVTVGAGGAGRPAGQWLNGNPGGNSSFTLSGPGTTRTVTVYGGGGGSGDTGGAGGSFFGIGAPGSGLSGISNGEALGFDAGGANQAIAANTRAYYSKIAYGDGYSGGGSGQSGNHNGSFGPGGNSVYGGAGGGTTNRAGFSIFGGQGGAGVGSAGTVPGGGGGTVSTSTEASGAGAPGRVRVVVY